MLFRRAILLVACLTVATGSELCAGSMMGRYNPQQTSYTADKITTPLSLSWEYTATKYEGNPAAPVIADGVCYFASGDRVYAVDMKTGSLKWKYPSEQALGSAIKCTPAVADGKVYFGSGSNMYCLDAKTGVFQWAYAVRGSLRCPPIVSDGILYFGSDDDSLYTVNTETGDPVWTKPFTARDDIAVGVATGGGVIVVASMDGNMYGIGASSGKLRWISRLSLAPTATSPVVSDRTVVMAVGNLLYGMDIRSGQLRWSKQLPSDAAATPSVNGSDIFVVCKNKKLYAFAINGRQVATKWAEPVELAGNVTSSPVIANDTLYVTTARGTVIGLATADGTEKWRYAISPSSITTPGRIYTNASSAAAIADGNLVVLTDDGVAHCFNSAAPDSSSPEIFAQTPRSGYTVSGAPPVKMSAILYDIGSGVDFSSLNMLLDDQPVEYVVDYATSTVTYQTEAGGVGKSIRPLANGNHTVTITAKDFKGNVMTKSWYFLANSSIAPVAKIGKTDTDVNKKTTTPTRTLPSRRRNRSSSEGTNSGQNTSGPPMPPGFGGSDGPPAPPSGGGEAGPPGP